MTEEVQTTIEQPKSPRETAMGLGRMFIGFFKDGIMSKFDIDEVAYVEERLAQLGGHEYMTDEDRQTLQQELDVTLGRTPEQKRGVAMGLGRMFIGYIKNPEDRHPDEIKYVEERLTQLGSHEYMTDDDRQTLQHELDVTLGRTPEQLREAKLGLGNMFIKMLENGEAEPEHVKDLIEKLKAHDFMREEDRETLQAQLNKAIAKLPPQQ